MLIRICSALFFFVIAGCSDGNGEEKDPGEVLPASGAITDTTRIINDSIIVADTNAKHLGREDSAR